MTIYLNLVAGVPYSLVPYPVFHIFKYHQIITLHDGCSTSKFG
jgi:hypothetical protein